MTARCCDVHDFETPCGQEDVCCAECITCCQPTRAGTVPRVDIEDTGPALEAIAAKAFGEAWATMWPGKKALAKQELLDLLLPGLQVILDQVNEQLAEALATARERERRVAAVDIDGLIEYEKEAFRQGNRETEEAVGVLMQVRDHLNAALFVEAVDHPQGERSGWVPDARPLSKPKPGKW
ncbi:hypothetical protein GCM10009616_36020 [Microlunatus lacustris]